MRDLDGWQRKLDRLVEVGRQRAAAKAALEQLEHSRKSVIAMAALQSEESSDRRREWDALQSEAYNVWLEGYAAAVELYERHTVRYFAMRTWFEMARTVEATNRSEMQLAR